MKHMPIQMYEGIAAVNSIYKYRGDFIPGSCFESERSAEGRRPVTE